MKTAKLFFGVYTQRFFPFYIFVFDFFHCIRFVFDFLNVFFHSTAVHWVNYTLVSFRTYVQIIYARFDHWWWDWM